MPSTHPARYAIFNISRYDNRVNFQCRVLEGPLSLIIPMLQFVKLIYGTYLVYKLSHRIFLYSLYNAPSSERSHIEEVDFSRSYCNTKDFLAGTNGGTFCGNITSSG